MLIEIMMVTAFVSLAILVYTTETGLFGAPWPVIPRSGVCPAYALAAIQP